MQLDTGNCRKSEFNRVIALNLDKHLEAIKILKLKKNDAEGLYKIIYIYIIYIINPLRTPLRRLINMSTSCGRSSAFLAFRNLLGSLAKQTMQITAQLRPPRAKRGLEFLKDLTEVLRYRTYPCHTININILPP